MFQNFKHHHFGPPVSAVVALHAGLVAVIFGGAKITVGLLARNGPFYPRFGFGDKFFVVEDICERQQSVNPVGTAFPLVAITPQPAVAFAHYERVKFVEFAGGAVFLADEHFFEPALGLNGA
ncbi:hypothetical protein D3C87_1658050 [compost metagenome]